jgi:cellulose synthase (UDP-forming)
MKSVRFKPARNEAVPFWKSAVGGQVERNSEATLSASKAEYGDPAHDESAAALLGASTSRSAATATLELPVVVPAQRGAPDGSLPAGEEVAHRHLGVHRRCLHVPPGKQLLQRIFYGILLATGFFLVARFALFWFSAARLPRDFGSHLWLANLTLFAALTFVVWHRQMIEVASWLICSRIEPPLAPTEPAPGLRVAFLTTFVPGTEPIDMLARTLMSMVATKYPHDTWVLDEGNDPDVVALCDRIGVKHFSRSGLAHFNTDGGQFAAKTKGGNHNAWYVTHGSDYDIVAQADADFTVRDDYLTKTLGHFRDPQVAFVGTPQIYGNMDNLVARGAAEQTYLFYGPLMRSLSRRKMALLIGANHVIRVKALAEIGWYNAHLTEDLATGKRFHADRWKSVYVPEPLAVGEGPTTWSAYFNQQYRWAFGCLNIFFTQSPRINLRMRVSHGFYYFLLEQFYFSGLRMATGVALLMLYFLFGWKPADLDLHQLLLGYAPLLAWGQLMIIALQRFNVRPREEGGMLWAGRIVTIAAIPIYLLALIGVIRNKRMTFKTTPKGDGQDVQEETLRVFMPHLVLSGVIVTGMILGAELRHTALVFYAWGTATSLLMSGFGICAAAKRAVATLRGMRRAVVTDNA